MRLLLACARKYSRDSALVLAALLLAGIAEGFGCFAVLPLLSTDQMTGTASASGIPSQDAILSQRVIRAESDSEMVISAMWDILREITVEQSESSIDAFVLSI